MVASSVSSARPESAKAVSVSSLPKTAAEEASASLRPVSWRTARQRPFQPVLELLRDYFGLRAKEAADVSRRRVRRPGWQPFRFRSSFRSVLLEFLGLADPQQRGHQARPKDAENAAARFCKNPAPFRHSDATTVVIIEDLHWIDAASEEFVEALADAVVGTTTLLVVNFRPGFAAPLMQRSHYRQINMPPLRRRQAAVSAAGSFRQRSLAGVAEQEHRRARPGKSVLPRGTGQCTRGTRGL